MTSAVSRTDSDRPVIDVKQQIETLSFHHVRFEACGQEEAEEFLTTHTYFFKLKAFDKEFGRDSDGNYRNLDFADLKDVSTIDYHVRQFVQIRTGEIEHAMKTRFNMLLMRSETDGYQLTADFEEHERQFHHDPQFSLAGTLRSSAYNEKIITKYREVLPPWLIWEVCSFAENIAFYKFFLMQGRYHDAVFATLDGVRKLRNAAAHHNCVLTAPAFTINQTEQLDPLLHELFSFTHVDGTKAIELSHSDPLVHDFACVICTHINLVQGPMRNAAVADAVRLRERIGETCENYQMEEHLYQQLNSLIAMLEAFADFDISKDGQITRQPVKHRHHRRR